MADEREHVVFYLAEILYKILPAFYDEIAEALGVPPGPLRRDLVDGKTVKLPDGRKVKPEQVLGERRDNGLVSFYAAGVAVMFLLFSTSAAGGSLLEEMESGTLERVLSSRSRTRISSSTSLSSTTRPWAWKSRLRRRARSLGAASR